MRLRKGSIGRLSLLSVFVGAGLFACSSGGPGGLGAGSGGAGAGAGRGADGGPGAGNGTGNGASGNGTGGDGGSTIVTTTICVTAAAEEDATLTCPEGSTISSIDFASYGTPTGACESFAQGDCHSVNSQATMEAACLGQNTCTVEVHNGDFGGEPCDAVVKHLNVQATCTGVVEPVGGTGGGAGGGDPGAWNEGTELKAFPTAEGYGRVAKGGRGGRVIHVTNLNDSGEGSLRAAVDATGARTVVFDVGGTIRLKSKLVIKNAGKLLTIAGQTAPGKGIIVRDYAFGMIGGEDVILRFIRTRVGTSSGVTQDGMGQTSSNNTIFDHCSISWTIDEGFSSRNAKNITLQRTLISECLNDAGHEIQQSAHGYAASINGDIGSFHHNMLAHCVGRNWSLAGGLKGGSPVTALGRLDIRNNVVYNWQNRTTDGEIYQVNFVNNYYKKGPESDHEYAISLQFYDIAENLPQYYVAGNVMPGVFDADEVDKSYTYPKEPPGDYWATEELWDPHVETQTAVEAYSDVLADVGANVPMLDDHDKRILQEVKDGTYKYVGSRTGLKGHIDNEADAGGHETFETVTRPTDWDVDRDGMPGAWETAHGLDPNDAADGNGTNLSKIGYTNLEMYLNELAGDLN